MNMKEVYFPIESQMQQMEKELADVLNLNSQVDQDTIDEILKYFFQLQGKRFRPALALLSAGMVNESLSSQQNQKLIKLVIILELIHNTSLIHDDIIDDDALRRGQKTLNGVYGRKIAVLAGDVLYAKAFTLLTTEMPASFVKEIVKLTEDMCAAEIEQAKAGSVTEERYLSIIRGKTAEFMSASCRLGGKLAGANKNQLAALSEYGMNLGITYQLIDDLLDGDIDNSLNIDLDYVEGFAQKALHALDSFENSEYKDSLEKFVKYILNFYFKPSKTISKNA